MNVYNIKFKIQDFYHSIKAIIKNWKLGYGFVDNPVIFDSISYIGEHSIKTLKLYKKAIIENRTYGLPVSLYDYVYGNDGLNKSIESKEEDIKYLTEKWIEIIDDIIFFFEYGLSSYEFYPDKINSDDYKKLSTDYEIRYKKGGELFTHFYRNLWD